MERRACKTLIVIPARYGSTRFPGKPLAMIAGQTMLARVAAQARAAAEAIDDAAFVVATDDERIIAHCRKIGAPAVMTDKELPSGSDRALAAAEEIAPDCDFIINLQGDAPFTPVQHINAVVTALKTRDCDAATPCIQLTWNGLDRLREQKTKTPFSGTTCIMNAGGKALWFSKKIIPSIRREEKLREETELSPVLRHVGLYGFRRAALERFTQAPRSMYEELEELEQLRMIELGMSVQCVTVQPAPIDIAGVDSPEDLQRLEALIAEHGDPGVVL